MANVIHTILAEVASQIANLSKRTDPDKPSRLENGIVDTMVDLEEKKRIPAVVQGLEKLREFEKDHEKVDKADSVLRDQTGKVIQEGYTAKRLEEIKKAVEKIEKLRKAIEKAYEHGDLKDLNQLLQSGGKDKKEGGTEATGEAS